MIPLFPEFAKLHLDNREEIEEITKKFPPYSDFHFTSLWSYNTNDQAEISLLNHNLIIKFEDYITNEPFLTFIGNEKLLETVQILLDFAKSHGLRNSLGLIPQHSIKDNPELYEHFSVQEDRDNFDYILPIDTISDLAGNSFRAKRNFVNRYKRIYPQNQVSKLDLTNENTRQQIIDLFNEWKMNSNKSNEDTETELTALHRLLDAAPRWDLYSIGIYNGDKLIAFSINELAHDQHSIIHFEKADINYTGIYQYLKQLTAVHLKELGSKYINYEQDLGIEGLRKAKESWNPSHFLKKYIISSK